jgi:hypothetical protein
MGLFDLFSGSEGEKAARQSNMAQQAGLKNAKGDINKGTKKGVGALQTGQTQANTALDTGVAQAAPYLENSAEAWRPLYDQGLQGVQDYYSLLNNPDAIYDSELYKGRETAGLEAINRGANARGMLASGNNTQDQIDYMRKGGLDYFNTMLQGYQPSFGLSQGGAAGLSGVNTNLSNLYNQLGTNKANVATGTASGKAGLYSNQGNSLAGLSQGQGQANADMYTNQYNANQAANQNLWGAIMGVGNMAASAAGAMSDRRAKQDIKQVGTLDNGLPVYLFRYKHGGPFQIGLMAQDVEKVNPSAVTEQNGIKHVFYVQAVGA